MMDMEASVIVEIPSVDAEKKEVDPERRNCLNILVRLLTHFGLWEVNNSKNLISHARYLFPRFVLLRTIYSLVVQSYNVYLSREDTQQISEHAIMISLYFVVSVKFGSLFHHRHSIRAIIQLLEQLNEPKLIGNEHNIKRLEKVENNMNKTVMFISVYYAVLLITSCSITLFIEGYMKGVIPFTRWYPYDQSKTPMFELSLIFLSLMSSTDFFVLYIVDLAFVMLLIQIIFQFRFLRYNIENMRKLSSKKVNKVNKSNQFRLPLGQLYTQRITDTAGHSSNSTDQMKSNASDKESQVFGEILDDSRPVEVRDVNVSRWRRRMSNALVRETELLKVNRLMDWDIGNCVKHHQILIRITKDVGRIFKDILTLQLFLNAMLGAIGMYISTISEVADSKVMLVGGCMLGIVSELFVYCWCSDQVTVESLLVSEAAYASDWLNASVGFKRSIRIIMDRAQKPLFIRAGGIPLSRRSFKSICKTAHYVHTLLTKLYFGEKLLKIPE